jgi:hypothetical protein
MALALQLRIAGLAWIGMERDFGRRTPVSVGSLWHTLSQVLFLQPRRLSSMISRLFSPFSNDSFGGVVVPCALCALPSRILGACVVCVQCPENHWSEGRISKTDGSDVVSTLCNNDNVLPQIVLRYVFLLRFR